MALSLPFGQWGNFNSWKIKSMVKGLPSLSQILGEGILQTIGGEDVVRELRAVP